MEALKYIPLFFEMFQTETSDNAYVFHMAGERGPWWRRTIKGNDELRSFHDE